MSCWKVHWYQSDSHPEKRIVSYEFKHSALRSCVSKMPSRHEKRRSGIAAALHRLHVAIYLNIGFKSRAQMVSIHWGVEPPVMLKYYRQTCSCTSRVDICAPDGRITMASGIFLSGASTWSFQVATLSFPTAAQNLCRLLLVSLPWSFSLSPPFLYYCWACCSFLSYWTLDTGSFCWLLLLLMYHEVLSLFSPLRFLSMLVVCCCLLVYSSGPRCCFCCWHWWCLSSSSFSFISLLIPG